MPGVNFVRLRATTKLFRGMKAHYGTSLTLAGRARSRVDGNDYAQSPGTLGLKQPGQIHRDLERDAPGSFQLVSFDAELVEESRRALDQDVSARLVEAQVAPQDDRARSLRRLHDLVLAGEVVVERRAVDAEDGGEPADAQPVETLSVDDLDRGAQHLLPGEQWDFRPGH